MKQLFGSFPVFSLSRREWLSQAGGGFGWLAASELLAQNSTGKAGIHHAPKAKRVIQLFMNGGVSQMDTFDYKEELEKRHGQEFQPMTGEKVEAVTSVPGKVMKCPFPFARYGQSGRYVSSVLPHLASQVDDLAFLMSVTSKSNVHGPASFLMNTGFVLPGFPSMGAWMVYGLGKLTDNLPAFVVLPDARGLPYNGKGNFSAGFLPTSNTGTIIQTQNPRPIPDISPSSRYSSLAGPISDQGFETLERLNRLDSKAHPGDDRLEARIASFELAAKMQLAAPEAMDLTRETKSIQNLYGLDQPATKEFGSRCLIARRLIERGVRFVQVWSGAGGPSNNWDNHTSIPKELPPIARQVDQPTAALLMDLKSRGLLEDTLLLWSTEFGRHPFTQGADGRDHNQGTSVAWLAGAGIKKGTSHGESDPFSWRGGDGKVSVHDYHATVLHLLGIDHEKLTFQNNGAERRLTDVHGYVIKTILA